jgi:pimeloyl-ACP methyl ester carboxylesterase
MTERAAAPTVDVARIAAHPVGTGRPILFVHGWTMDHRDERDEYEPVFAARPGWRRVYFDLPGMGSSPVQRHIGSLDGMLDAVCAVVREQIGDARFAVAGTSAGAYLVRGLLHRLSAQVDGVLLRAPMVVPDVASRDVDGFRTVVAALPREAARWQRRDPRQPLIVHRERYATAFQRKQLDRVEPAQAAADLAYLGAIREDASGYRFRFDVDAARPLFEGPTLIVTGRQDLDVGYRDPWRVLMPQFPRATFVALDRAEHGLPIDQSPVFRALVGDWLDRVEETTPLDAHAADRRSRL